MGKYNKYIIVLPEHPPPKKIIIRFCFSWMKERRRGGYLIYVRKVFYGQLKQILPYFGFFWMASLEDGTPQYFHK